MCCAHWPVEWWVYCRNKDAVYRLGSDHILLTTVVASALPHLLKMVFDQERPDRTTVRGHWRGAFLNSTRFASIRACPACRCIASAASVLPAKQRNLMWGVGAALVLTRIVLLAHWASDVGLAVGTVTERLFRHLTGYGVPSVPKHAERS